MVSFRLHLHGSFLHANLSALVLERSDVVVVFGFCKFRKTWYVVKFHSFVRKGTQPAKINDADFSG